MEHRYNPKEDLIKKLKKELQKGSSFRGISNENNCFECYYDCFLLLIILQAEIENLDNPLNFIKNKDGEIKKAFLNLAHKNYHKNTFNPFSEIKKVGYIINNETEEKFEITNEKNFETIISVIQIIKINFTYKQNKEHKVPKDFIKSINIVLYEIISNVGKQYIENKDDVKTQISRPGSINWSSISPVSIVLTLLLFAFMFIYLFGSLFFEDNSGSIPENCSWQYTQDNVVCW